MENVFNEQFINILECLMRTFIDTSWNCVGLYHLNNCV